MSRPVDPASVLARVVAYVEEHGPCRALDVAVAVLGRGDRRARQTASIALHNACMWRRLDRIARGLYDRPAQAPDTAPRSVMGRLVAHVERRGMCLAAEAVRAVVGDDRRAGRVAHATLAVAVRDGRIVRLARGVYASHERASARLPAGSPK